MPPIEPAISARSLRLEPFDGSDVMISIRAFVDQSTIDGHQAVLTVRDIGDTEWTRTITLVNREG